jgi:hypothetical protein
MVAGDQVWPPLVDTSTPATTPPPASVAVPVMTPPLFAVIVDVGGVASVGGQVTTRPGIRVAGCAPMSAKRLTVACCVSGSGAPLGPASLQAFVVSSPHDHCTVPAPNTSAPLGARYSVRWWVSVTPFATLVPKSVNACTDMLVCESSISPGGRLAAAAALRGVPSPVLSLISHS